MSVICQNFVENTWRKDLCSNCFKSAADHSGKEHHSGDGFCGQRYISQAASIYHNRHPMPSRLPWLTLMCSPISSDKIRDPFYSLTSYTSQNNIDSPVTRSYMTSKDMSKGILKEFSGRKTQRKGTVSFVTDDPLVIGYGGNDYDSDESPWELTSDDGSVNFDGLDVTEEDRTLTRITKSNTEFNATNRNLLNSPSDSCNHKESESATVTIDFDEEDSLYNDKSDISCGTVDSIDLRNLIKYSDKLEEKLRRSYFATNENILPQFQKTSESTESAVCDGKERLSYYDVRPEISHDRHSQVSDTSVKSKVEKLNKKNLNTFLFGENSFEKSEDPPVCITPKELKEKSTDNPNAEIYNNQTECLMFSNISDCQIIKVDNCEPGSDSDYSTSRQASSELSTDSESFNDAEEVPIVPCSSFLHSFAQKNRGTDTFGKAITHEKTYYALSSSSGNVSDESDSTASSNRTSKESEELSSQKEISREPENVCKIFSSAESHQTVTSSSENIFESDVISRRNKMVRENDKIISEERSSRSFESFGKVGSSEKSYTAVPSSPERIAEEELVSMTHKSKIEEENQEQNSQQDISAETVNSMQLQTPSDKNFITSETSSLLPAESSSEDNSAELHSVTEDSLEHDSSTVQKASTGEVLADKRVSPQSTTSHAPSSSSDFPLSDQKRSIVLPTPSVPPNNMASLSKADRHAKLAALAFELEQARCDSTPDNVSGTEVNTPDTSSKSASQKEGNSPVTPYRLHKSASGSSLETTFYGNNLTGSYDPTISKNGSDAALSTPRSKLISIPDTSKIKGKFSFKKLLKKNKDQSSSFPNGGEHSLKAWKRNHFDRSRLSLEIVHPMDLQRDVPSSTESTPTDDRNPSTIFVDPAGNGRSMSTRRARSLSALPNLPILSSEANGEKVSGSHHESSPSTSSLNRKGNESSKTGTGSEKDKKAKAPTRRPSLSALRSGSSSSSTPTVRSGGSKRPPKPPPPPRETPPLPVTQNNRPNSGGETGNSVPARPPPPKGFIRKDNSNKVSFKDVQSNAEGERNANPDSDSDYANLGDIRSHITPKKPQRQSVPSKEDGKIKIQNSDFEDPGEISQNDNNTYEILEATEEEDHYTYLDESEIANGSSPEHMPRGAMKNRPLPLTEDSLPENGSVTNVSTDANVRNSLGRKMPCCQSNHDSSLTFSVAEKKPWFDLQTSYEAITASNYESLAELITTAFNEEAEHLQKNSASLRWGDFELECNEPIQILGEKVVYNAICKVPPKTKVTVMLTTEKHHMIQITRNPRVPVLTSFSDYVHAHHVKAGANAYSPPGVTKAMIYVLQRSKITTLNQFALDSSCFQMNQHVHLRNACFVLLQLIHNLKNLQADGIEEIEYDISRIFLVHTDADKPPIMLLLSGDKAHLTRNLSEPDSKYFSTLCQVTLKVMFHLLQINQLRDLSTCVVNGERLAGAVVNAFTAVAEVLSEGKAASLSQAKGLLEYMLWGPVDVTLTPSPPAEHVNVILQRWLDLQRARMIKALVSNLQMKIYSHSGLHIYEEYQLIFLLQSTVKSLKDVISKI